MEQLSSNQLSECSCAKCDSFDCFALRSKGPCSCPVCKDSQSCLLSKKKITNITERKSMDDNAMSQKIKNIPDSESVIKECVKKEITYEYNNNHNFAAVKKHSNYSYCCAESRDRKNEIVSEIPPHVHSVSIVHSRRDVESNTAKLSAQIMNVPYKEFKESVSYNRSDETSSTITRLSKLDIFKRIKEAYKACSCKVCECIAGKSLLSRNEYCKCKPCNCQDCAALAKDLDKKAKTKQYYIGCPCIRCDRINQCKGLIKKTDQPKDVCDCDPCDCLRCVDSNSKPCNCKPCECIECKSYRIDKSKPINTIVVASIREDVPRSYCQCSPCDCAECGQDYPMSSSLRHEMATGISRPANCACENCMSQSCEANDSISCTCEIQKQIMRKPVEKDTRDYDIHRASVKKRGLAEKRTNHDTIAMFASVKDNYYPKFGPTSQKKCSCGNCECVICSCKETTAMSIKSSRYLLPSEKTSNKGACQCSPCECEICNDNYNRGTSHSWLHKTSCKCDVCDCLNCVDSSKPSTSNAKDNKPFIFNNTCKCSPCECADCQKIMYKCTGDSCYCSKCKCQMCSDHNKFINETVYTGKADGNRFPSTFGMKLNDRRNMNINKFENQKLFQKGTLNIISRRSIQHINNSLHNYEDLDNNPVKEVTETRISKSSQYINQKTNKPSLFCEAYVQCRDKNVIMKYCNGATTDYKSSVSFMSENVSLDKAKLNDIDENSSIPPVLMQENTSHDTKSTHDKISNMFPTTSFSPTCLDEFMKNLDFKNISFSANENRSLIEKTNASDYNNKYTNKRVQNEFKELSTSSNGQINQSEIEATCVRDLSINLVTSLKNANERLSSLISPKCLENSSKLGPSEANISLPNKLVIMKENTEDFCNLEIDYDKIKDTLQQAKAFSEELMKVLLEYKKANKILESKSHKQIINKCYGKHTNINKSTVLNREYNRLAGEVKQRTLLPKIDSMNKYGSHNLNIEKNIRGISDGNDLEIVDIKFSETLSANRSSRNNMIVDSDQTAHANDVNTNLRQNKEGRNDCKLSKDSISGHTLNEQQSEDSEVYENYNSNENSCTQFSEDRRKNRSDKRSQKRKRVRVPRSVLLYKRLKLKEALMNLAADQYPNSTTAISSRDKSNSQTEKHNNAVNDAERANNSFLGIHFETATSTSTGTRDTSEKRNVPQILQVSF